MGLIFKAMYFLGTYKFWDRFRKPLTAALIYSLVIPFFGLTYGLTSTVTFKGLAIVILLTLPVVYFYFMALEKLEDSSHALPFSVAGGLIIFFDFLWIRPILRFFGVL